MMEEIIIESPKALAELSQKLAPQAQDAQCSLHVHLKILQPLTYKHMLDHNRSPESRVMKCVEEGTVSYRPSKYEHTTIKNLNKAWRMSWARLPVASIQKVTFDMNLDTSEDDKEGRVKWKDPNSGRPQTKDGEIEISLDEHAIATLLNTMVLVMHQRSAGRVEMGVTGDDPMPKGVRDAIEALATNGTSHQRKQREKEIRRRLRKEKDARAS